MSINLDRRSAIPLIGLGVMSGVVGYNMKPDPIPTILSPVSVMGAKDYSADLLDILYRGAVTCGLGVVGKRVLLKPNLVEYDPQTPINTDPRFVAAAVELFRKLGAAEVRIGEGPGHRRDSWAVAEEAGYRELIPDFDKLFVDLNRDDVVAVKGFDEPEFFFSKSLLAADLIVSLAKMKTHHWAGVTLSMKNFFGLVPGCVYGWPKNILHYKGIDASILELNRLFPNSFAMVDGIMGMEGNGPIQGTGVHAGVVVMGNDMVAVDATCCRLMKIDPMKIGHIKGAHHLGYSAATHIEQRGERVESFTKPFGLMNDFAHLRLDT
jgi:uncharacterized protein (DUF362 family)